MNANTFALADAAALLPSLAAIDDPLEWEAFRFRLTSWRDPEPQSVAA